VFKKQLEKVSQNAVKSCD